MESLLRLWLVVFILTLAWSASGAERVAIVFGNDSYTHAPKLENAINDAGAVAEMLETQLDFKLVKLPKSRMFSRQEAIWSDCGLERFYAGIEAFMREAATARLGLVYYAGHGMEVDKTNYLIPVDAELSSRVQLRTQAVNVVDILADLKATGLPNKLLILDCCRDDPLTRSWRGTRSGATGLAEVTDTEIPESTLILFSAAPGQAALDGEGGNSPFTASLIEELPRPGRDALSAFFEVSDAVVKKTGNRQEPWVKFDGAGRTFRGFQFVEGIPNGQVKSKTDEELAAKLAAMQQEIERLKREKNRPQTTASEPKPMSIPQSPSGGHSAGTRGFTNSLGMEFVPVPGTEVLFSIYETRVKDYAAYASANSEVTSEWRDVSYGGQRQTSDHPVVNVSWEDAKAFCAWLSRKEGKTYRLPTDHEWSVAVGIGNREDPSASPESKLMVYPWGTTWPPPRRAGNFHGQEGAGGWSKIDGYRDNHPFTAPVGSYEANPIGLHDLGGSVWEWCEDKWYSSSSSRVLRGGSWDDGDQDYLLSSYRFSIDPSRRLNNRGFRCVVVVGSAR